MTGAQQGTERKISEAFLEFSEPLWVRRGKTATPGELEQALKVAWLAWNSMVTDTIRGDEDAVNKLRNHMKDIPEFLTVFDLMLRRKKSLYAQDLRLIKTYKLVDEDGQWRLQVEAASQ